MERARTRAEGAGGLPSMKDMRRLGLAVGAFALTVGIVLAGGVALRPVDTAQSAVVVDTAPIEATAALVADSPAVVQMSAPSLPAPEQIPTPVAALAAAAILEMKHVWQSLNNCGPAAVVMALSTLGIDPNQE